jgi:excinuclease ABC subunit A
VVTLAEPPQLEKKLKHTIEVVIDRLVAGRTSQAPADRLRGDRAGAGRRRCRRDSSTDEEAPGPAAPVRASGWPAPTTTRCRIDEIEPRSFSFNSPFGACPSAPASARSLEVDPDLVVPDEDLSLAEGAIAPWAGTARRLLPSGS